MSEEEMDRLDADVPRVALAALNAAHERARASGLPVVMVIGDGLYRVTGETKELIRMLPPQPAIPPRPTAGRP